jgi:hypothetical protein
MTVDYILSSLPALTFGDKAPMSWERFTEIAGGSYDPGAFSDLETQIKNAIAEARGGEKYRRPAEGVSLYWRNRTLACFQEHDVAKRERMLDKVRWDAAGELADPASPLGRGALATYAERLKLLIKNSRFSAADGEKALSRLTDTATAGISNQGTNQ